MDTAIYRLSNHLISVSVVIIFIKFIMLSTYRHQQGTRTKDVIGIIRPTRASNITVIQGSMFGYSLVYLKHVLSLQVFSDNTTCYLCCSLHTRMQCINRST